MMIDELPIAFLVELLHARAGEPAFLAEASMATDGDAPETSVDGDLVGGLDPLEGVSDQVIYDAVISRQKRIIDVDDREEVVDCLLAERRQVARSVAAVVEKDSMTHVFEGLVELNRLTLGQRMALQGRALCEDELFSHQPTPAVGTAFLVSPTLVISAYHVLNETNYRDVALVFDFEVDESGQSDLRCTRDRIHSIKRYVAGEYNENNGRDWSLLELESQVSDRASLKLSTAGNAPNMGTPLYVVGHPSGLPKKIAGGARVTELRPSVFRASLDTYGGNSGSPVLNAHTNEVEGILVRGGVDYVPVNGCYRSLVCDPLEELCLGEECIRVAVIMEALRSLA